MIIGAGAIVLKEDLSGDAGYDNERSGLPITRLGRSMISLRIEKQKVQGTGAPDGFNNTQCEYTDCVVFSNA